VATLGVIMPLAMLVGQHTPADALLLGAVAAFAVIFGLPLARHLWSTPSNGPQHLPHRSALEDQAAAAVDRYSTKWGGGFTRREGTSQ